MHIPEENITLLAPSDSWYDGTVDSLERLKDEVGAENVVLR
jgi:DNA polymerase-3 subunit alpha